jgi:cell division protein FtsL
MPWSAIVTMALQIIGMVISKQANDAETQQKFNDLATHLQAKKLASADMKLQRDERLERLRRQTEDQGQNQP